MFTFRTLLMSVGYPPSSPNLRHTSTLRLDDLPRSILSQVAALLDYPSLKSFSCVSRECRRSALTILGQSATITRENMRFFYMMSMSNDVRFSYVRRVSIGNIDLPFGAEPWNVRDILHDVLDSLPSIETLKLCGGTYVEGWSGLDEMGQALGAGLRELDVKILPPMEATPAESVFPHVHTLSIRFIPWPSSTDLANILNQIHPRFPSLVNLQIHIQSVDRSDTISPNFGFFSPINPVFPYLRTLHLTISPDTTPFEMDGTDLSGLMDFLLWHKKITGFSLPLCCATRTHRLGCATTLTDLRYLRASLGLVGQLAPCLAKSSLSMMDLHELHLSDVSFHQVYHISPFRVILDVGYGVKLDKAAWPYSHVSVLTLQFSRAATKICYLSTFIANFFPQVVELHLDFSSMSQSQFESYEIAWDQEKNAVVSVAPHLHIVTLHAGRSIPKASFVVVQRGSGKSLQLHREAWDFDDDQFLSRPTYWDTHYLY